MPLHPSLTRLVAGLAASGCFTLIFTSGGCTTPTRSKAVQAKVDARSRKAADPEFGVALNKGEFYVNDPKTGHHLMRARPQKTIGVSGTEDMNRGPITFIEPICWIFKANREDMKLTGPRALWKDGKLLAEQGAHVESVDGTFKMDARRAEWTEASLRMWEVTAVLYKKGRPDVKLSAPEVYTRGEQLVADRTAHAESPDGLTKLDALTAIWDRPTAHLWLTTIKGGKWEKGRQVFAMEGPRAEYKDDILTLPEGATGRRLDGLRTIRADRIRWNQSTGALEAFGNVRVESPTEVLVATHIVGNTTLKKGKADGLPRPRVYFMPQTK